MTHENRSSFGLAALASVSLVACSAGDAGTAGLGPDEQFDVTVVRTLDDGTVSVSHAKILRSAQERANREGSKEALSAAITVTQTESGVGSTSSAITQDWACGGQSIWLYDQSARIGNMVCFQGRGMVDLATVCRLWSTRKVGFQYIPYCTSNWFPGGMSAVRSYWPGTEEGSLRSLTRGNCVFESASWTANGPGVDVFWPLTGGARWLELQVWGKACWLSESHYTFLSDAPKNVEYDWTDSHQGLAQDATYNYLTSTTKVLRSPKSLGLSRDAGISWTYGGVPYAHYGDGDVYNGKLYVPLEAPTQGGPISIMRISVPDMTYEGRAAVPGAIQAAWVAFNPKDGMLYTSDSGDEYGTSILRRGTWTTGPDTITMQPNIQMKHPDGSPLLLSRIQGGAFSSNGHLYLVSDNQWDTSKGGIYGIDVESGYMMVHIPVQYSPSWTLGAFDGEELEGLTIDPSYGPHGGQIHLSMINVDAGTDNAYVKHFGIDILSKL